MTEVLADLDTVETIVGTDTIQLPSLTGPYNFLFTVMHLFREAWFERNIQGGTNRLGSVKRAV